MKHILQSFNDLTTSLGAPPTSWLPPWSCRHQRQTDYCKQQLSHQHQTELTQQQPCFWLFGWTILPITGNTHPQSCQPRTFQLWKWHTKERHLHQTHIGRKRHLPTRSRSLGLREAPVCVRLSLLQRKQKSFNTSILAFENESELILDYFSLEYQRVLSK